MVVVIVAGCSSHFFALQEGHIAKLREGLDAGGDASLQNGLELAVAALKTVPPYGHREVSKRCAQHLSPRQELFWPCACAVPSQQVVLSTRTCMMR